MASKASSKVKKGEIASYAVVIIVIVAVLAAIVYVYKAQKLTQLPEETQVTQSDQEEALITPTPTPTKLFHGKDTYYISGGAPDDPHFPQVDIDPLDPEVGASQKYTVKITSKYPVSTAFLSIRTDTHTTKVPLTLVLGTREEGTWEATWSMPETYLYNYQITPTAQTAYTQSSSTITIRQRP